MLKVEELKRIGDRYLTTADYASSKGVWLRIPRIHFAAWFSAARYGSIAKAKKAAKAKRDQMLLCPELDIDPFQVNHGKRPEDNKTPKLVRNCPEITRLRDIIKEAMEAGLTSTLQLRLFLQVCLHEGQSVVDLNGGEYGSNTYYALNSAIMDLGDGTKRLPGKRLLRRGERGQAIGGTSSAGEQNRKPLLLTESGFKLCLELIAIVHPLTRRKGHRRKIAHRFRENPTSNHLPTFTNSSTEVKCLLRVASCMEKAGLYTLDRAISFVNVCLYEGQAASVINDGEYSKEKYTQLNSIVTSLGDGKSGRKGLKLVRRGKTAHWDGAGVFGEWLQKPVLLTASGLRLANELVRCMGGVELPAREVSETRLR